MRMRGRLWAIVGMVALAGAGALLAAVPLSARSGRSAAALPAGNLVGNPGAGAGIQGRNHSSGPAVEAVTSGYKLDTFVRSGVVPVKDGVAQISCGKTFGKNIGPAFAVGGGVLGNAQYAVGATFPVSDAQGRPTGWAGALTELPRFQVLPAQRVTTERALRGSFWDHSHHLTLPTGLLRLRTWKGYSTVSMYVRCMRLALQSAAAGSSPAAATPSYKLVGFVRSGVVPVRNGVAQISCGKTFGKNISPAFAFGGGVRGDKYYAVGATFPVSDAQGRPTGWAGALTELPKFQIFALGFDERPTTDKALTGTVWSHSHRFLLPGGLLRRRDSWGYSTVSMYVVCVRLASSGAGSSPAAATPSYKLVTFVRSGSVPWSGGFARISCGKTFGKNIGPAFAPGGGVRGNAQYAVGATAPGSDAQGRPTGWAGALTELPTFQIFTLGYDERPTTERALYPGPWSHRHRFILPAGLLRLHTWKGYSTVSTYVVCVRLASSSAGSSPPVTPPPTVSPPPTTTTPTTTKAPTTTTANTTTTPTTTSTTNNHDNDASRRVAGPVASGRGRAV